MLSIAFFGLHVKMLCICNAHSVINEYDDAFQFQARAYPDQDFLQILCHWHTNHHPQTHLTSRVDFESLVLLLLQLNLEVTYIKVSIS